MGDLGCAQGIAADTDATLIERTGSPRTGTATAAEGRPARELGGDNRECDVALDGLTRSW
jgi:hypothetical protein